MILRIIGFVNEMRFFRLVTSFIVGAILALVERSLRLMIVTVSIIGTKVGNHLAKKGISLLVESGTAGKLTFNFFGRFKFGIFLVLVPSPDHHNNIIEGNEDESIEDGFEENSPWMCSIVSFSNNLFSTVNTIYIIDDCYYIRF